MSWTLPTAEQVKAQVVTLASDNYDFVYPRKQACVYVPTENAHCRCIIGKALSDLGVPDEVLARGEGSGASYLMCYAVGVVMDARTRESVWFDIVQILQDKGEAWGRAVALANEIVSSY